jgi:nicotinate-nucleotide--dimethylbenzimidazole phosphoribosyltransferase
LKESAEALDLGARLEAEAHQSKLTKPPGSLGRLEEMVIQLSTLQHTVHPCADRVHITVFAADHGVAAEGVSAFPQSVTAEMLRNFARGGAAISILARELGASLGVVDLGTVVDCGVRDSDVVRRSFLGRGTRNFAGEPAMTESQLAKALWAGREAAGRAKQAGADLFIGGDMGIGNSTAAATLGCALLGVPGTALAGSGTGLSEEAVARKARTIDAALDLHAVHLGEPLEAMRCVSGFEIVALTGCYITCAQFGLPTLVDGFIATAAALAAVRINPGVREWLLFSHRSAEKGHDRLLDALEAKPLLDLGLRLGEGSGAALAVPLLRLACALHNRMATFAEAGVSEESR